MKARLLFSILGSAIFAASCAQSDAGITTSVKTQLAAEGSLALPHARAGAPPELCLN